MKIYSTTIGWRHLALGLLGSAVVIGIFSFWPEDAKNPTSKQFTSASIIQPFKITVIERGISAVIGYIKQDVLGVKPVKVTSLVHTPVVPGAEQLSRINFFLTEPVRASLAVPEAWEGKYRLEESGRTMNFLYLPSALTNHPMFSLELVTAAEATKMASSSGQQIKTVEGYAIIYRENQKKNNQFSSDQMYQEIEQKIDSLLKTLKAYKQ